ncbi:GNAT family N-acetyltransferase [Corynebacterium callunae]|uniref:Acetyl transferase n=1 Tax=Corynebacterium callunae DSM 20147 TaxID=1121353 RepID=M1UDV5_9CORY|nr:GNAT family N-acetyltransferase [Corynebacterium callunae]AGG66175.1 acetyl transferase [Corynebacterium callunae DSM 20147]
MIKHATSKKECRDIRLLFTSEMSPEWELPELPRKPAQFEELGTLLGAWEDNRLVGAAFISPASTEANAIYDNLSGIDDDLARDSYTWLREKVVFIELIATVAQYRRRGIAHRLLSKIQSIAADEGREIIIAVAGNNDSRKLFAHADYIILQPNVGLVLTANQNDTLLDLGILPGVPDCAFAVKEIGRSNRFSFMITHPDVSGWDHGTPMWQLTERAFHVPTNR